MAASQMIFLVLISCCFLKRAPAVPASSITINPDKLLLTTNLTTVGGLVSITCRATGLAQGDNVLTLSLDRSVAKTDPDGVFVSVLVSEKKWNGFFDGSGANASLSVDGKDLLLKMPRTQCGDAGNYTCKTVVFLSTGSTETSTDTKSLDVEVNPEQITLTPVPLGRTQWLVNETLEMICNGVVGTVKDDTEVEWIWEYRNSPVSTWERYQSSADITAGTRIEQTCYTQWSSTLTRKLTVEDNDRDYRCFVRRNGVNFMQTAAMLSVGTVSEEKITTPAPNPNKPASKANVGPIIGGVLGALVVIIVIIVVIVFLVRRRSSRGETYAAGESANKPAEDPNPYVPDPGVSYTQPNRFRKAREPQGVANTAMDEVGEKPPPSYNDDNSHPPRYANDFHQGRRNQGYDYEPDGHRGRRHSSDEDGTNSRINTSQLSLGHGDPSIGTPI